MKEKIPIIRSNYGNNQTYFVNDLKDRTELYHVLGEVYSGVSEITPEGLIFFEKEYGFVGLAEILSSMGGLDSDARTTEQILKWLNAYKQEKKKGF